MPIFESPLQAEKERINAALSRAVNDLPNPIREIAAYTLLAGGKRLRPLLTLTAARMFGYDAADIYDICVVPEMFHAATLLHDDILDTAQTRRGKTAAHLKFGLSPCILAGDALLAEGCRKLSLCNIPAMLESMSQTLVQTIRGEIEEIAHIGAIYSDQDTYLSIIEGKTAWLLRCACEIGALRAGASPEQTALLGQYGLNLGYAFQIVDDALDFADEKITGKPTGGDVRERKCTPPILFYAASLPSAERAEFERKFREGLFSGEEISSIVLAVQQGGFAEQSLRLADGYLNAAEQCLKGLPSGKNKLVLKEALNFVRNRAS